MGYLNSVTKGSTDYAFNGGSQFIVCSGGGSNGSQYTFTNPTGFAVTDSDFNKSITYRFLFQNCWFSTTSTTTVTLGGKKIMSVQPDLTNSSIDPASNGLIQPLPRHQMTINASNRYYAITANTVLEMYYDSSLDSNNGAWVIVGNPIVMSASNYTVYANGLIEQWGHTSTASATIKLSVNITACFSITMIPTSSQRDGSSYSGVPLTTNPSNPNNISYPLTQVEVKNCAFYSIKGY